MKKIILFLLLILALAISGYSAKYNETYDNLSLDNEGWCEDIEIVFTLYNKTQWDNRSEIENDMCRDGENPEDDDCSLFQNMTEANVTIYDGPFESRGVLHSVLVNTSSQFSYTFEEADGYLMEIEHPDEFNALVSTIYITECSWLEKEETGRKLYNQSYSFLSASIALHVNNTESNDFADFSVKETTIEDKELPELEDNLSIMVEVSGSHSINYTSLTLDIGITREDENSTIRLFKGNDNQWEEIENFTFEFDQVVIADASFGIYAVTEKLPEPEEEEEIIVALDKEEETSETEEETSETVAQTTEEPEEEKPILSKTQWIIIGIIFIIIILGMVVSSLIKHYKTKMDKMDKDHGKKEDPVEGGTMEHLHSYAQAYEKGKQYVQIHKKTYEQDVIVQALQQAHVPEDIVKRIIDEEYKEDHSVETKELEPKNDENSTAGPTPITTAEPKAEEQKPKEEANKSQPPEPSFKAEEQKPKEEVPKPQETPEPEEKEQKEKKSEKKDMSAVDNNAVDYFDNNKKEEKKSGKKKKK